MNAGLLIIILLLGLALLGFPIYIALGIGALAALNLADLPLIVLPQRMFAGMNGSALLAIPFFILAGNIMSRSITGKLIDICNAIIGHIKGSLSLVTILASALFGAISGSGVATASAIGGITIPAMKREGYPAPFAVGVASISSILGPIIPPSIVLIVYASITNVSVAELFLGSVLPGIILAVALIAYGLYYGHKHNLPAHEKPNLRKIGSSVRKGIWALLMPIIILGGIFGGIFTPTEASAVAVVYSLIISLFVYKDMSFKELPQVFVEGAVSTATDAKIVNNSFGAVKVNSVSIEAAQGWSLAAFGDKSTLAHEKVNSNKFGFQISLGNGEKKLTDNKNASKQTLLDAAVEGCYMSGVGDTSANSIGIEYDAIVTPVSEAVTNTAIASVLFIIAWDAV